MDLETSEPATSTCPCGDSSSAPISEEMGSGASEQQLFWRPGETSSARPVLPTGVAVTATGFRPSTLPSGSTSTANTGITTSALPYRPWPSAPTGLVATGFAGRGLLATSFVPGALAQLCCPVRPGLNTNGPLVCGPDLGSFSAEEREEREKERRIGGDVKLERHFPSWYLRKSAGPSDDHSQWFYEAYCTIIHAPGDYCDCKVQQELELTRANDALIESFLRALAGKYDRETTRPRLNGNFNPHEYLYPEEVPRKGQTYRGPNNDREPRKRFPVGEGLVLNDYIQGWVKRCCPDATRDHLALVDGPGQFSKEAEGVLHFTITFRKADVERNEFCATSSCAVNFDLVFRPNTDEKAAFSTVTIRNEVLTCGGRPLKA